MVIHKTRHSGAALINMRCELGEWGSAGRVRQHPLPGLKHHRFALRTGRSPAVTIAWVSALSHPRNAVSRATEQAYA